MERNEFEDMGLIEEVAGREPKLTENQEITLNMWDFKIQEWCMDIDKTLEKQRNYKEYVSRTHDYKNYDRP